MVIVWIMWPDIAQLIRLPPVLVVIVWIMWLDLAQLKTVAQY